MSSRLVRQLGIVAACLAAAACRADELALVDDLPEGTRLVLVSVDEGGRALAAVWWEEGATLLETPAGGSLLGFELGADALSDDRGRVLETQALRLRLANEPVPAGGGCGRCFSRAAQAPQRLSPGESCPPPPFAKSRRLYGEIDEPSHELVREQVRLDAPGACPCAIEARPAAPTVRDLELAPLGSELAAWPVEEVSAQPSGELGLFGEHVAVVSSSVGERLHERPGPFVFGGPVMAAAPDGSGGHLVFVHEPSAGLNEQLRIRLASDLTEVTQAPSPIRAVTVGWLPSSRAHLISGHVSGGLSDSALLWLCAQDDESNCFDLSAATGERGSASQIVTGDGEPVLAELFHRALLVFERIPAPDRLARVVPLGTEHGELSLVEGPAVRWRVLPHPDALSEHTVSFVVHRSAIYACGRLDSVGVYALPLDHAFYVPEEAAGWTRIEGVGETACVGAVPKGDEVQIVFADGSSVLCATSPAGVCRAGPASPIADDQTATLRSRTSGFELAFAPNHIRQRAVGESEWHPLYGLPPTTSPVVALAASAETLMVARRDGTLERYRLDPSGLIERDGGWSRLSATPVAATYSLEEEAFWVSVECASPQSPALWRLPRDGGEPEPIELEPDGSCRVFEQLAELGPSGISMIGRDQEIYRMDFAGALHPVRVEWDDPETANPEARPELLDWRSLSARGGVAVAVGHGPALVRIDGRHEPDRAHAVFLGRSTQTFWNPLQPMGEPEPQALAGRCPDHWRLASRGKQRANFEVGVIWQLSGSPSPSAGAGLSPTQVRDETENAVARSSQHNPSGIRPRGMVGGDGGWTVLLMDNSLHRVGASWRIRYIGARTSAVVELPGDRFVLGTDLGDLYLGSRRSTE